MSPSLKTKPSLIKSTYYVGQVYVDKCLAYFTPLSLRSFDLELTTLLKTNLISYIALHKRAKNSSAHWTFDNPHRI